jgi:hypothetical protein
MKQFDFKFEVICATALRPDLINVEEMINLYGINSLEDLDRID